MMPSFGLKSEAVDASVRGRRQYYRRLQVSLSSMAKVHRQQVMTEIRRRVALVHILLSMYEHGGMGGTGGGVRQNTNRRRKVR